MDRSGEDPQVRHRAYLTGVRNGWLERVCSACDRPWPCETRKAWAVAEECQAALAELVELKIIKDRDGKTDDYKRRQPLAWEQAKKVLGMEESDAFPD